MQSPNIFHPEIHTVVNLLISFSSINSLLSVLKGVITYGCFQYCFVHVKLIRLKELFFIFDILNALVCI